MAGIRHPAPTYQGRTVVPMEGSGMLPWLTGREDCTRSGLHLRLELMWSWRHPKKKLEDEYHPETKRMRKVAAIQEEFEDLAYQNPVKLKELLEYWEKYVKECIMVQLQPGMSTSVMVTEEQMPENAWMEYEYWRPRALKNKEAFMREPKKDAPTKGS
ncbi:hypothetical protein MMC24_000907 [Lignoscripta atroalba]|nr:hypothetical protein [Lignoscripta atroalba]